MKKSIFLFCVFILYARENPFESIITPNDSTNKYYGEIEYFKKTEILLPSNARLIKNIEITYQNIDGSFETKSIDINNKLDWESPITISQNKKINKNTKKENIKVENKNLFIEYKGDLLRHFTTNKHTRIVLDFTKNIDYYRKNKIYIDSKYFKSIKYGLHDKFLRIVVELNKNYIYKITQSKNGILINVQ